MIASSLNLQQALESAIEPGTKGVPPQAGALKIAGIGGQGWNILQHHVPLPVAVLKDSALRHNSAVMRRFVNKTGTKISPHGKTTMAPQLFERQLADGAWGITAATVAHVAVYRRFGVPRIFMANQLVDPVGIDYVLDELARDKNFEFFCLVDSVAGVRLLTDRAKARACGRPLAVAVEVGAPNGRTGARSTTEALAVARAVADAAPYLALRGVEAFEGIYSLTGEGGVLDKIAAMMQTLRDVAQTADRERLFAPGPVLLTAGGSAYFEEVARELKMALSQPVDIILRSGCYLVHDHGLYEKVFTDPAHVGAGTPSLEGAFRPALEVWGSVQSVPEPGLAILTFGKRDVSYDMHLPKPILWHRPGGAERPRTLDASYIIRALNDQHAYLTVPDGHPLQVGDMVAAGISHPCTTFDKWQVLHVVDDDYNVIEGIRTYF